LNSCCFVCSIAGVIESMAEMANAHLELRTVSSKVLRIAPPIKQLQRQDSDVCYVKTCRRVPARSASQRITYSYLNASTGSSFEARIAGTSPLITPTISKTTVESITVIIEIFR
jgi:hypothetical protein